jgi:acetyltransferase-like isoleucine patch superfamily enzyme
MSDSEEVIATFPPEADSCWRQYPNGTRVHFSAVVGRQPRGTAATRRQVSQHGKTWMGRGCEVGPFAVVYAGVRFGEQCLVGDHAIVREGCMIGDRCVIGANADLQYHAMIGNDVVIQCEAHIAGGTIIGDGSFIGPGVRMANDRTIDLSDYRDRGTRKAPVIGKRVFVGVGAILLPGITIGDDAVIAAGALVTRDVPEGSLVKGSASTVTRFNSPVPA